MHESSGFPIENTGSCNGYRKPAEDPREFVASTRQPGRPARHLPVPVLRGRLPAPPFPLRSITMSLTPYLDTFPRVGERTYVHPSAQVIGDVQLGEDCSLWCNTVLRGDVNRIVIGRCSNVQDLSMGHVSHRSAAKPAGSPLVIGDFVTIGHAVILHGCTIGDDCLIGMGSIVMDDAVIQPRVMLGAGSLVSPGKVLESGFLYVGRPAVKVRPLDEREIAYLRYSAEHYVRVKDNHVGTTPR